VKCSICGQIKESSEMTCVGFGGVNIGECRQCARKGYDAK
jgi:ribosome-binding protein aMBF1 (putative translation factor)